MQAIMRLTVVGVVILNLTVGVAGGAAETNAHSASNRLWVRRDGSLMMALRSNARHFWQWAADTGKNYFPEKLLQFGGIVAGDAHQENFAHIFVNGRRVYVMNDWDDSGEGPLFLDFVKFLAVTLSASEDDAHKVATRLFQAYLSGSTDGPELAFPRFLTEDASVTEKDHAKNYLKKIKHSTSKDGKFNGRDGMIPWAKMTLTERAQFSELEGKYFAEGLPFGYEIKDRAIYAKGKGGSAGSQRYWFSLVRSKKERHILEFKPVTDPAVAIYNAQKLSHLERAHALLNLFWSQGVPEPYGIVGDHDVVFWRRPRYPNYLDMDLASFRKHPQKFFELSNFIAYRMGALHAQQRGATGYVNYLKTHTPEVIEASVKSVNKYLELATAEQKAKKKLDCSFELTSVGSRNDF